MIRGIRERVWMGHVETIFELFIKKNGTGRISRQSAATL